VLQVDHVQQSHLLELVGDVPDHDGCSALFSIQYLVEVNIIVLPVLRLHHLTLLLLNGVYFFMWL
jgi:hypothetical protein